MPAINAKTFFAVKEVMCNSDVIVAFTPLEGHHKHPPLISWKCIDYILKFDNEGGLREL